MSFLFTRAMYEKRRKKSTSMKTNVEQSLKHDLITMETAVIDIYVMAIPIIHDRLSFKAYNTNLSISTLNLEAHLGNNFIDFFKQIFWGII